MTHQHQQFARGLETRLRPIAALATAAAAGGRDSNQHRLPGLAERLEALPDDLEAIREWIEANAPAMPERRRHR